MAATPQDSGDPAALAPAGDVLEIRGPDGRTTQRPLADGRLVIGRTATAEVQLDSDRVSRRHADLFRDPFGRWWIRDLGSRNGTRVNGVRATERVIAPGDRVEIGGFVLRLRRAASAAAPHETTQIVVASHEDSGAVATLGQLKAPMVAASHLSTLLAFGQQLLEVEDAAARLELLCGLMADAEFGGGWAAAVRVPAGGEAGPLHLVGEPAAGPGWRGGTPHLSKTLLGAVQSRGEPVLASNLPPGPVDVRLSVAADVLAMSALACPLRRDAGAMDVLYVVLPPEFGTGEWLALASLAVEQLHQADAAWTARREAQVHAAIEGELAQARKIQMRLIPRDPRVAGLDVAIGFEPCRWVGGDYVDVVATPAGATLLTVADTCGKGLQAALVAASVHSLVHAGVRAGLGLADLMRSMNEHLLEYLPEESFVTMGAVLLDPATGEMASANAGHPAALVAARGGGLRHLAEGANFPLGVAPAAFEVRSERLGRDEMLALYTDGIADLPCAGGGRLGTARLADLVGAAWAAQGDARAAAVAAHLAARLDEARGDCMPDDDRTFLLVRRT